MAYLDMFWCYSSVLNFFTLPALLIKIEYLIWSVQNHKFFRRTAFVLKYLLLAYSSRLGWSDIENLISNINIALISIFSDTSIFFLDISIIIDMYRYISIIINIYKITQVECGVGLVHRCTLYSIENMIYYNLKLF